MVPNPNKLDTAGLLQEILEDWGLDHQGAIGLPYNPEAAEATVKNRDDSKFLFGLGDGTIFECDWVDSIYPNPWEVKTPDMKKVFVVDLTDPESLDIARSAFFIYKHEHYL
jgi:hypothetical protein